MAARLTSERANTDKMVQYIGECRAMEIAVLPPDCNQSQMHFTVVGKDIRFGLAAIKNVGEGAVEAILAARSGGGPFKSVFEFCERVDLRAVNRRVVGSFIQSGSFHSLEKRPASLMAGIRPAKGGGRKKQRDPGPG